VAIVVCDNAIPHLLTDAEIEQALVECYRCLCPGGGLVISVRDYDRIERKTPDIRPYGSRVEGGVEYTATQVWEWEGDRYDLRLQLAEHHPDGERRIREFRSRYYAIGIARLQELMTKAGFAAVHRRDDGFFQPLLVGTRGAFIEVRETDRSV
jgi:SAM-dependent methyltransferase